jgi:iron complex outermembrane receptor protein
VKNIKVWPLVALCALTGAVPAFAQRSSDNVMASAQDAFGTTVGNESIGLYTARDVRGFDPIQAGNVRLEGLYFDRQRPNPQEIFVSSLIAGSSVRVGLSAQSYLFPAPSGIADVKLRLPGEKQVVSAVATYGFYSKYALEVNAEIPITDTFAATLGGGYIRDDSPEHSLPNHILAAAVGRWRPNDSIEVIPFWSRKYTEGNQPRGNILTAGPYLPPEIPRHVFSAQDWMGNLVHDSNFGTIVNASLSDNWRLRTGLFRSLVVHERFFNSLFQNTQPDGMANRVAVSYPRQEFGSYSGEVRLSGVYTMGDFRHTVHVATRGRYVQRNFGGSSAVSLGPALIGTERPVPLPMFNYGPLSHDRTRQGTGGVAYEGLWAGVGEVSFGLQKTHYRRALDVPVGPDTTIVNTPWLPNATLAVYASDKLTFFGSYTRGLEESGEAPNSAANRGEALPAIRTSQIDAGFRYILIPGVSAVVTAFDVKKPYINFNTANFFTNVGNVRHRGIEFSVAGRVAPGLTVVAGSVFLRARVTGDLVDRGLTGEVPIGRTPRYSRFDIEYGPQSWAGMSIDAQFENRSSRVATADNLARIPARTIINLGGRYRFKAVDAPATLRFQVRNVTNVFGWDINGQQQAFSPEEKRRFMLNLAVDF